MRRAGRIPIKICSKLRMQMLAKTTPEHFRLVMYLLQTGGFILLHHLFSYHRVLLSFNKVRD